METKVQTFTELAQEYNVSLTTLHKWLKPIKLKLIKLNNVNSERLRILNKQQLQEIYNFLGEP